MNGVNSWQNRCIAGKLRVASTQRSGAVLAKGIETLASPRVWNPEHRSPIRLIAYKS